MKTLFSLLAIIVIVSAHADTWQSWATVALANPQFGSSGARMANDGTNIVYCTYVDGVYRAALADGNFSALPLTGFPLWDANTQTNGLAVTAIAATPQGTVVIAGNPVQFSTNGIVFNPPGGANNTLPVFYWFDETNQIWQASGVTGHSYPYTGNTGNFSIAPDGSLWTCSGFYPYAYRSTDGGKNFTAFDINARVPTNYIPLPLGGYTTFGEVFSVCAGWGNEVVIGTETGGFLHTTNNGATWRSLDPNFTVANSMNPLGRIGDGRVAGVDRYGNFLCANFLQIASAAQNLWGGVKLIGWNPKNGAVFAATNGLPAGYGVSHLLTRSSGVTYTFMNQGSNNLGGVYRMRDGKNWSPFNDGLPSVPTNVGNALAAGNCMTVVSNTFYIGFGSGIYKFDSTPPPVVNRPPVALPQNVNLWMNSPTNFTLTARDADGDVLNYSISRFPTNGTLTGTPPNLTYTPTNNFRGTDWFTFAVDDGMATSAPVIVNLAVTAPTNLPPVVSLTTSANQGWALSPAAVTVTASVAVSNNFQLLIFYNGTNQVAFVSNPPLSFTFTNLSPGDYLLEVQAVNRFEGRAWAAPIPITVLPFAPRASIKQVDSENVAVTWPLDLDGFYLESAPNANGPWTLSPFPQFYFTNGQTATIPAGDQQFFRLMRP
jgi:hypothetical protein